MDPNNRIVVDDYHLQRQKIIHNQTIILNELGNGFNRNLPEYTCDYETEKKDMNLLIEMSQRNISFYSRTNELNKDTQEAFDQILQGMEATEDERQGELAATHRRLKQAKESLDYVLTTFYPEMKPTILKILRELEESSLAEDEEEKFRELDTLVGPVLVLLKSFCIVAHPSKTNYYKLNI